MALDIVGVVGGSNMQPDAKETVIAIMHALNYPATVRRYLYARWARVVGILARPEDLDRVAVWGDGE